jgi:hypothetical protein
MQITGGSPPDGAGRLCFSPAADFFPICCCNFLSFYGIMLHHTKSQRSLTYAF